MKFWNKKEHKNWTLVMVVSNDYRKDMLQWCRQHPSTGKFYRYYGNFNWWFEKSEDATLFALRWR